ncbi:bifunctional proline dehydrogenase/L-glutamate gamma-semialdehyde dehydrogenase PutA [Rheinheimera baltica]|uniref:bifunctional proline dehydrogenase/L-glutamate gamma-semialdehyde dehydrogenase PutA n=1 Tax=Rheinheimera baltica TaxID=67576 RepID=UPI00273EA8EB|nr:bifunctional proline dehydrogenase/L-glutamate gamma-semialdehyde dehydrogenase PutA [Rheinheimera baltica]MDP5142165.1 bifunctional proline dehydrogenase/L-glutamate gamma-semialdehyde dehydrogenase PutA [Rheinheimera baltica]MDP5150469.1 bifunctional proline dehydrogenase/L-glutamate gamma-semialdehyde dehydrogenase PutA [Rheinheimera baltica]
MLYNGSLVATQPLRQTIRNYYRADEDKVLEFLLPLADIGVNARSRAWERARQLVLTIRQAQVGKGGVDALLNEFSLSTEEGLVLMCLAEALLRVPDKTTADRLIRDKLSQGDWSSHLGNSSSVFVNASAWGLLLTGKLVNYSDEQKRQQFGLLKRTCGRLGEPVIRQAVRYAMQIMGAQFVMGTTISAALERATDMESKGFRYSYDMLGEGARTMADADRYFDSYMRAIDTIGKAAKGRGPFNSPGISVKLSAIHPRYEFSHRDRVMEELIPRVKQLALAAKAYDIGFTIDAEEADRLDISLDIIEAVFSDPALDGWEGFGLAVQAYQKRGIHVIEWLRELTVKVGRKMMVRLVKGAYWDTEIKVSQLEGFNDFPVFSRKPATDVSYQACAKKMLNYRDSIYPQFATHNAYTVATIMEMTKDYSGFEFQRLHGMGDALYDEIVINDKIPCRIYAPVGEHSDLLAYLVRRLLENGANSSFVNNIVDESIPVESLLSDPVEVVRGWSKKRNQQIPLPAKLYGAERLNSNGLDLTEIDQLEPVKAAMTQWFDGIIQNNVQPNAVPVTNPAKLDEVIGYLQYADAEHMQRILANADTAFSSWAATDIAERAALLRRIGDALETHRNELLALCIKEAGKTLGDSVAEVREAIDFCRYYAARAEELFSQPQQARGVFLCISPWNFPLAIFLGQVAAAIVVGNTVVAKPAEQTSLIALRTLEIMRECGMPEHVVQLVIAPGRQVGEHIVPDSRIQGVMFTGSTETGCWIARKLAERGDEPVPLIAETGGQNCMIVDSTALPEQVVDDVISSGFQSAGQRCSALRVLFLQEDVADKIITMLKGAMAELHVGDPMWLSTDLGPVIDAKAHERLTSHVQYLADKATLHYECKIPSGDRHYFFAPRLYEIADLTVLEREVFGPVVHIIRFKADELDNIISQINATGYGLTMGVHSRIEQFTQRVARDIKAGNIYVNRNMIGAVVGVQPFGGRGLSGTGPKAGGPLYLTRLVKDNVDVCCAELSEQKRHRLLSETTSNAVAYAMPTAAVAQQQWARTNINQRTSVLRQFLASLASNAVVTKQEPDLEQVLTLAQQKLQRVERDLQKPITLPGPTGETNVLVLDPRGILALVRDDSSAFSHWLLAIITALAAGNAVITAVEDTDLAEAEACIKALLLAGMPQHLVAVVRIDCLTTLLAHQDLAGAMVDVSSAVKPLCAELLAAREGAILPLITAPAGPRLLQRLVTEKTITINTTAAGGNASLMTMADNAG